MKIRSRGTSTSSKIANASCSSSRDDSGWSKEFDPTVAALSRQRKINPGVSIGLAKLSAYASVASPGNGRPGYTVISSANGARVARMRAPRTMMPVDISATLCSGTGLPANDRSFTRSIVGWTIVWVRDKSSRAIIF